MTSIESGRPSPIRRPSVEQTSPAQEEPAAAGAEKTSTTAPEKPAPSAGVASAETSFQADAATRPEQAGRSALPSTAKKDRAEFFKTAGKKAARTAAGDPMNTAPGASGTADPASVTAALGAKGAADTAKAAATTPATLGNEDVTLPDEPPAPPGVRDAIERIQAQESGFNSNPTTVQANLFAQELGAHKDDPAWMQSFYSSLGSKKSAELISAASNPATYSGGGYGTPADQIQEQVGNVRDSLTTLAGNGSLNKADMDKLMGHWTKDGESLIDNGLFGDDTFNYGIGQLFAGMPPGAEGLKNTFFQSATDASKGLSGPVANSLASSAANVLASTSADNQQTRLSELQKAGQLQDFTAKAVSADREAPTVLAGSSEASNFYGDGSMRPQAFVPNDGIAKLMFNIGYADIRDPFQGPAPVSSPDLQKVRTEMFGEAVKAFGDSRESTWGDSTMMKDALANLYMKDFDTINKGQLSPNQAQFSDEAFGKGMSGFFQNALFTPPAGAQSKPMMDFLSNKFDTMSKALSTEALKDKPYNTQDLLDSHFLGLMQGTVMNGLQQAKDKIAESAETTANALSFVLGTGLSFVPGAGKALGELSDSFIGKIFDGLSDKAKDAIKDMTVEQAKDYLIKNGEAGLNYGSLADALRDQAAENVLHYGGWGQAYDDAKNLE